MVVDIARLCAPEEQRTADIGAMIKTYGKVVDFVDYATLAPIVEKVKERE